MGSSSATDGETAADELCTSALAGPDPRLLTGFSTCGEIARTHGTGGFHNQTLVVLAVA